MATTWAERLRQLIANGQAPRLQQNTPGNTLWPHAQQYPWFIGLYRQEHAPCLAKARQQTQAPVRISEEWYPDVPYHVVLYQTTEGDLSAFWAAYLWSLC